MDDYLKQKLMSAFPPVGTFQLWSSKDYPEDGMARLRGVTKKYAFFIEWNYVEYPDHVHIQCQSVEEPYIDEVIELSQIKNVIC